MPPDFVPQLVLLVSNKETIKLVLKLALKKILTINLNLVTLFLVIVNNHVLEDQLILLIIKPTDNVYLPVQPHQCKLMDSMENVFLIAHLQHGQTLFMPTEYVQLPVLIQQEGLKVTDSMLQENVFQSVLILNLDR